MMSPQKPPERGTDPQRPNWTPGRPPQPKQPERQPRMPERKPEIGSPSHVEEEEEVGQIEEV